jgi:SAM-dependent methyltransferase
MRQQLENLARTGLQRLGLENPVRVGLHRLRRAVHARRVLRAPLMPFLREGEEGPAPGDPRCLAYPGATSADGTTVLWSGLCSEAQLDSPAFRHWAAALQQPWRLHRKLWEFCFICQALYERGMLESGRRGLCFAVGEEPLPALFASRGCEIVATDLEAEDSRARVWADTAQLATSVEKLSRPGICDPQLLLERVSFRPVDMNKIPDDLRDFDFTWSSCSFEHCGSIELGLDFVANQMRCLRPGGVAVHTTEFNLSSNDETLAEGGTVIFRKKDIDGLVGRLEDAGHFVEPLNYALGSSVGDKHIDTFPYADAPHLKLLLAERFVSTSVALIVRKKA